MAKASASDSRWRLGGFPTAFLVVAALYLTRDVLIPLALAVLLSFLLAPFMGRLERLGIRRPIAALITVVLAATMLIGIGWTVERQFMDTAQRLPQYAGGLREKLRGMSGEVGSEISKATRGVQQTLEHIAATEPIAPPESATPTAKVTLPTVSPENPMPVREFPSPPSSAQLLWRYMGVVLGPLGTAALVIVFVIFILLKREDLRDRLIRLAGGGHISATTNALDDAATRVSRYLIMQSMVNGMYGAAIALGLWVIGRTSAEGFFPNVLLWGFLAAMLRFIPYVGAPLAAAVPVLLSLVLFRSAGVFAATVAMYLLVELVTYNLLEPWLYGATTGLSALAILVSAVFWTWIWGPMGLLLSTPLTVCLIVIGKHVPKLEFLDVLLGDEVALAPPVRVYQRLLAMDYDEASEAVEAYRRERTVEQTYEEMLIGALIMAEQDHQAGNLDDDRYRFVCGAIHDLLEEAADAPTAQQDAKRPDPVVERSNPSQSTGNNGTRSDSAAQSANSQPATMPEGFTGTIACLPARSEADEIAAAMLGRLLELRGYKVELLSQASLISEMLEAVNDHAAIACVSALPPGAVGRARSVCKRLRLRFPEVGIVAGLWQSTGDIKRSESRIGGDSGSVKVVTTFTRALEEIHQLVQPMLLEPEGTGSTPTSPRKEKKIVNHRDAATRRAG